MPATYLLNKSHAHTLHTLRLETRGNETQRQGHMCLVEQEKPKTETEREGGWKKKQMFQIVDGSLPNMLPRRGNMQLCSPAWITSEDLFRMTSLYRGRLFVEAGFWMELRQEISAPFWPWRTQGLSSLPLRAFTCKRVSAVMHNWEVHMWTQPTHMNAHKRTCALDLRTYAGSTYTWRS